MRCVHSDWLRQCVGQSPDPTARPLLPLPLAIPCLAQPQIPYTRLNHLSPSRLPLSILLYCASWQKSLQTRSPLVAVQLFDCDQLLGGEFTLPGGRDVGRVTGYTVISPYQRLLSRHCFMYDHVTMAHIVRVLSCLSLLLIFTYLFLCDRYVFNSGIIYSPPLASIIFRGLDRV